jgi:hypothetical protein
MPTGDALLLSPLASPDLDDASRKPRCCCRVRLQETACGIKS